MKRPSIIRMGLAAALLACVFPAAAALAQQGNADRKPPHIAFLYPAGGQAGSSVEVTVGGENVYGATAAILSGKGVSVQILDAAEPESAKDPDKKKQKKKNQTVLDELVKLKVTLAPDAAPGEHDFCLAAPGGVSNKLVFQVGQLKEVLEAEPNDKRTPNPLLALPVTVNGRIMPGDEDLFRFSAKKGQRLVFEASARALIPYIADAVPGWFQAILSLRDAQGRELAVSDSFRFRQDPVLFYEVPADGDYLLAVRDSIYRGREDFVYRIRAGELPFITGIFPLGAQRGGKPVTVTLAGWNLPDATATVIPASDAPVQPVSVTRDGRLSNSVPFAADDLPELMEDEADARREKGQKVEVPALINGRIRAPGETDSFRFQGVKGQSLCLEVMARRLGSPLDSRITLLDGGGAKIGENDDVKDPAEGFLTHPADSELAVTLPADGVYTVRLDDTQGRGGDEYAYRLRISPPMPDFELRVTPAAVAVPRGASVELTLHAIRRDGFKGEVRISQAGGEGLRLDGALVPAGVDTVRMTVSAAANAAGPAIFPRLAGTAVIDGKTVSRPVLPAEDLMQAFLYQHLMPFREQVVVLREPAALFSASIAIPPSGLLALPAGKETAFPVSVARQPGFSGPIRFHLVNPPKGVTLRNGWIAAGKNTGTVTLRTEAKVELALRSNLIFAASTPIEREATPEERARIEAREAKKAAVLAGTAATTPAAGAAAQPPSAQPAASSPPAAETPKKPLMITRQLVFTMPAVPFKVVEAPKTPKKTAEPPPATKGTHAGPNRKK